MDFFHFTTIVYICASILFLYQGVISSFCLDPHLVSCFVLVVFVGEAGTHTIGGVLPPLLFISTLPNCGDFVGPL